MRPTWRWSVVLSLALLGTAPLQAQTLQLHFMDVGQGDGAVLIAPGGQVVLFDDGLLNNCDKPVGYLRGLGIDHVDYHIASHYHSDHIGCAGEVLGRFPLTTAAIDRGGSYHSSTYVLYVDAVKEKRRTGQAGQRIVLGAGSARPVTIEIVALDGNGQSTSNENDLSLVAVVHYGRFDAVMGGDLSGFKAQDYLDIESSVASKVGQVEVYKVNHHCSAYSTNDTWLETIKPRVGIISVGRKNRYGHPAPDCLERLHDKGVVTYWTETGAGAEPEPDRDFVAGNIVVTTDGEATFTVTSDHADPRTYSLWGAPDGSSTTGFQYAWSVASDIYHYAQCRYVSSISPANLQQGGQPPAGKQLHSGCPK